MESPPFRGLDSNLYMQTSAEYRACCIQAFHWSKRIVNERLTERICASERTKKKDSASSDVQLRPPAVILDLDETVFDNRAFQTRQIREGWAYSNEIWSTFEQKGGESVSAIPGSVEFIQHLKSLGVQPVYITNRNANSIEKTREILKRLSIDVPQDLLLCADATTKSDKTSRRSMVRDRYDVLLLIGDNLRDFDDVFKYDDSQGVFAGIETRKLTVDRLQDKFGVEWILLPNPAYGEWNKAMGKGASDADLLEPRP